MAKSNKKIDDLCAALAAIGLDKSADPYDDAMRADGWISVEDIATMQNKSPSQVRKIMASPAAMSAWESKKASGYNSTTLKVFRPIG